MNPFYTVESLNGQSYKQARPWFAVVLFPVFFVVAMYVGFREWLSIKLGR